MLTVIIHSSESKRSATPSCGTLSSSFSTFLITWWLRSIGFPFIFAALIENSGFRWFSSVSENRCHVSRIRYSVLNRLVGTSINFPPKRPTWSSRPLPPSPSPCSTTTSETPAGEARQESESQSIRNLRILKRLWSKLEFT